MYAGFATAPSMRMKVPGGGSAGVGAIAGCPDGDPMPGPALGGGAIIGDTEWAVGTPGDGNAGSVVTDTTGVGAGVPAARDVVTDCPSATAIAQHNVAIAIIENLVMPLIPNPRAALGALRRTRAALGALHQLCAYSKPAARSHLT